jgi:hypothetical protein
MHVSLTAHARAQAPQLVRSLLVSTHEPPHALRPVGHMALASEPASINATSVEASVEHCAGSLTSNEGSHATPVARARQRPELVQNAHAEFDAHAPQVESSAHGSPASAGATSIDRASEASREAPSVGVGVGGVEQALRAATSTAIPSLVVEEALVLRASYDNEARPRDRALGDCAPAKGSSASRDDGERSERRGGGEVANKVPTTHGLRHRCLA